MNVSHVVMNNARTLYEQGKAKGLSMTDALRKAWADWKAYVAESHRLSNLKLLSGPSEGFLMIEGDSSFGDLPMIEGTFTEVTENAEPQILELSGPKAVKKVSRKPAVKAKVSKVQPEPETPIRRRYNWLRSASLEAQRNLRHCL